MNYLSVSLGIIGLVLFIAAVVNSIFLFVSIGKLLMSTRTDTEKENISNVKLNLIMALNPLYIFNKKSPFTHEARKLAESKYHAMRTLAYGVGAIVCFSVIGILK